MRRFAIVAVVFALACSREQPLPPVDTAAPVTTSTQPPPKYRDAVDWLRTTPGFHFTLEEAGARVEGDMVRPRAGSERVRFRASDGEWIAAPKPNGLVWQHDGKPADPPAWGPTAYQRIAVVFDPQKDQGEAVFEGFEDNAAHYRFTNSASGDVHHVYVTRDARIARIRIASKRAPLELTITQHDAPAAVPEI